MNMNRLISMLIRQVLNRGIGKGVQMASRRGPQQGNPASTTQKSYAQGKQAARLLRRFMR
jgi:hypothetical protein